MPSPIAAPTPLPPACAGVGFVSDSAAIAPANATPFPICPKRLETVWFVLMALSVFCNFKFDGLNIGIAQKDRHAGESAAKLLQVSVMFSIVDRFAIWDRRQ